MGGLSLSRVALVFPGQGSQQPGMGAELLEDPGVRSLCGECSAAAGVDLVHLLTAAGEDELLLTQNAQPALCFVGIALGTILARRGIRPLALAGHSVGEYAALCLAGSLSPVEAISLVAERGRAMAEAVSSGETGMTAVLGLPAERVEAALTGLEGVWLANHNTLGQTVIAGRTEDLGRAAEVLRRSGARRLVPLNVAAAFHTPLMAPAGRRLRAALDSVDWRSPAVPVVANLTAEPYESSEAIPTILEAQISSPVLWAATLIRLDSLRCDTFLELGPRRALTGMVREVLPEVLALALGTPAACVELELSAQ